MPGESLSFDVYWNDRLASAGIVRFGQQVSNASGDVKALSDGLDKLGAKSVTARVGLEGNKEANVELDKLDVKLIKLGKIIANPNITVEGKVKALADIAAVDLAMDRLNEKYAKPVVSAEPAARGGLLSILGRLGGSGGLGLGAGGLGAAGFGALGGGVAFILTTAVQAAGALAAAGAGLASFGALAAPQFKAVSGALTQINTDTAAYERATTAAGKASALKKIKQDWADISPAQRQAVRGVQGLGVEFTKLSNKLAPITFKVFNDGLKLADQLMPILLPFARAAGTALDGLLKSAQQFTKTAGFKAFIAQLQALSGPAITALGKGLGAITIAVGKLILAAAQPQSIQALARVLGFLVVVINAVSWTITRLSLRMHEWLAIAHQTANKFDEFRHDTAIGFAAVATTFDASRRTVATWGHDVAAAFDAVRHTFAQFGHDIADTFDRIRRFQGQFDAFGKDISVVRHTILAAFDDIRHGGAIAFDALRHTLAAAWDAMWHNTLATLDSLRHGIAAAWDNIWKTSNSQAQNGVTGIVGWFKSLPGRALNALVGLGHELYAFAHAALDEFWSGLKAVAGSVISWVSHFVSTIWNTVKKFFGISSPSSLFYSAGKNLMLGLEAGIKAHAHKAVAAAQAVSHQVSSAGSGVARWAPLVSQALRMEGLSPSLLGNVLYQMQTESSGNPNAINLNDINAQMGDPSRGLMQVIESTFQAYHWPGTSENIYNPLANIAAALNYARHVYGPSLMSNGMGIGSGHGYAFGTSSAAPGWAMVGERGPELVRFRGGERVTPAAAGNSYHINVMVPVSANKADTGRQVVEAIKEFERRSGNGWRN